MLLAKCAQGTENSVELLRLLNFVLSPRQYPLQFVETTYHRQLCTRFRKAIDDFPGLYAVGNYIDGASLNDCVRVANECAECMMVAAGSEKASIKEATSESHALCDSGENRGAPVAKPERITCT